MIQFGALTLATDLLRGGYSAEIQVDRVQIVVNAVQLGSNGSWIARVWVDSASAGEAKGTSAQVAISAAIRGQMQYIVRQLAALTRVGEG